jgi:hypothetical protein
MNKAAVVLTMLLSAVTAFAAPIPKALKKIRYPDVATATNTVLMAWSEDHDEWQSLVNEVKPEGMLICQPESKLHRYWILRSLREHLGGRSMMAVTPDD